MLTYNVYEQQVKEQALERNFSRGKFLFYPPALECSELIGWCLDVAIARREAKKYV